MGHRDSAEIVASLAALSMLGAGGCNVGPDGAGAALPAAFPSQAQLGPGSSPGDTVAVAIDSNYIPVLENAEQFVLHRGNTVVELSLPGAAAPRITLPVRSVFELAAAPTSRYASAHPGGFFTAVLFDLPGRSATPPSVVPTAYPALVRIGLAYDADAAGPRAPFEFASSELRITGESGRANPVAGALHPATGSELFPSLLAELGPRRMIRLRARRDASAGAGFPPGLSAIAGIQFELDYPTACVGAGIERPVQGFGATEAAGSTVLIGPPRALDATTSRSSVVLVNPAGFELPFNTDLFSDTSVAGEGPLIDLVFEPIATTCNFSSAAIAIRNLVVTGIDGEVLVSGPSNSTSYFERYLVKPPG
jgi:hypothetical protein